MPVIAQLIGDQSILRARGPVGTCVETKTKQVAQFVCTCVNRRLRDQSVDVTPRQGAQSILKARGPVGTEGKGHSMPLWYVNNSLLHEVSVRPGTGMRRQEHG